MQRIEGTTLYDLQQRAAAKSQSQEKMYDLATTEGEKLGISLKTMYDRLIEETKPANIYDINWSDKESIQLRSAQIKNAKSLIEVIKGLRSVLELLENETNEEVLDSIASKKEHQDLFQRAQAQIHALEIKNDIKKESDKKN